ncbi:AGAP004732-PA, partial [Anopheles gambiae str. PEST]
KPPPPGLRDLQFGSSVTPSSSVPSGQQIQPVTGSVPALASSGASSTSSSMGRDFRDGTKVVLTSTGGVPQVITGVGSTVTSTSSGQQTNPLSMPVSTLGITVVNSHGQIISSPAGQQPHSAIPPPLIGGHVQLSHHHALTSPTLSSSVVRPPNDEPQTLDLSIKKTPRTETMAVSAAPTKLTETSNNVSSVTVYRTDGTFSGPNIPPSSTSAVGGGTYVSYHPSGTGVSDAMGRTLTKSPSGTGAAYLTIPLGTGPGQNSGGLSMQGSTGSTRQSTLSSLTPPPPLSGSGNTKGKNTPKLSPKLSSS